MGAVGTWMIDCAYSQVGKSLGFPTHAYLGMTDSKVVDAQAGLEASGGTLMAALAGINMVSGAGMMDFESCQSFEKLVIDAEIIGMTKRLIEGIDPREDPIALSLIRKLGHRADYLSEPHTRKWFQEEQYIPSDVIDRGSMGDWDAGGATSARQRASARVNDLLQGYSADPLEQGLADELRGITAAAAAAVGMDQLPALE